MNRPSERAPVVRAIVNDGPEDQPPSPLVVEYLIDFNATQAAIRTGYAAGSAEVTGSRLLRNAKVQAAISAAQQQQTEKLGITVEDVLSGIARLARADIRKLFDERGNLHSIRGWTQLFAKFGQLKQIFSALFGC